MGRCFTWDLDDKLQYDQHFITVQSQGLNRCLNLSKTDNNGWKNVHWKQNLCALFGFQFHFLCFLVFIFQTGSSVLVLNVPPVNTMLLNANYFKQITFRFNILEKWWSLYLKRRRLHFLESKRLLQFLKPDFSSSWDYHDLDNWDPTQTDIWP